MIKEEPLAKNRARIKERDVFGIRRPAQPDLPVAFGLLVDIGLGHDMFNVAADGQPYGHRVDDEAEIGVDDAQRWKGVAA